MSTREETVAAIKAKVCEEARSYGKEYLPAYKRLFRTAPMSSSTSITFLYDHFATWFATKAGLAVSKSLSEAGIDATGPMSEIKRAALEEFAMALSDEWYAANPPKAA